MILHCTHFQDRALDKVFNNRGDLDITGMGNRGCLWQLRIQQIDFRRYPALELRPQLQSIFLGIMTTWATTQIFPDASPVLDGSEFHLRRWLNYDFTIHSLLWLYDLGSVLHKKFRQSENIVFVRRGGAEKMAYSKNMTRDWRGPGGFEKWDMQSQTFNEVYPRLVVLLQTQLYSKCHTSSWQEQTYLKREYFFIVTNK